MRKQRLNTVHFVWITVGLYTEVLENANIVAHVATTVKGVFMTNYTPVLTNL